MSVFDRIFGKGGEAALARARKAELRGDLARAVELWAEASRPDEAARVMIVRGDAESDARARLTHYTHAASVAPEGHSVQRLARKKRAELVIVLAQDAGRSAAARHDLLGAAADLEALGELARAAAAYALAGDIDGEARALANAGEVDRLEEVLAGSQAKDRAAHRGREVHAEIDVAIASGRRREALALAEAFAIEQPEDAIVKERATELRARRALAAAAAIEIAGTRVRLLIGDAIVVGRDTESSIAIASHAVSRRHVRIARRGGDGAIVVEDLGSRNGTTLRGMRVSGALPIGDEGLLVKLGDEVPLQVGHASEMPGAIAIEAAGTRYVAPLGPARVAETGWTLERASDGWLELVSDDVTPAFAGALVLVPRVTLLVGDAIAAGRGGDVVLRIA